MAAPEIQDRNGRPLSVGDRVRVDGRDESQVVGVDLGYTGSIRVAHSWLTGYHPDEPNPTEQTERVDDDTYRCSELTRIDHPAGGEG